MDGTTTFTLESDLADISVEAGRSFKFKAVIDEICGMRWHALDTAEIMQVAKAYYYFSIQFRENLEIACRLHPGDALLKQLRAGECDTDNLSPWPGVTAVGERLDHDEFMRRLLTFQDVAHEAYLEQVGQLYLDESRAFDDITRATSIASYEDGGLSRVFRAILRAPQWQGSGPRAFKFFLEEHIRFDTDDQGGHGALARHLSPDDRILPLWNGFRDLLIAAVPRLVEAVTPAEMSEPAYSIPAAA